jgi:hypothetical protein
MVVLLPVMVVLPLVTAAPAVPRVKQVLPQVVPDRVDRVKAPVLLPVKAPVPATMRA